MHRSLFDLRGSSCSKTAQVGSGLEGGGDDAKEFLLYLLNSLAPVGAIELLDDAKEFFLYLLSYVAPVRPKEMLLALAELPCSHCCKGVSPLLTELSYSPFFLTCPVAQPEDSIAVRVADRGLTSMRLYIQKAI